MRLTILASGSSGNMLLCHSRSTRVLVDAGLRPRLVGERLALSGIALSPGEALADAVLLTHEHGDHVCGAEALAERGVAVYATAGTARALRLSEQARAQVRALPEEAPLRIGGISVEAVALPHDAAQPVGYCLSDGEVRLGVLTDCGHPARELAAAYAGCDALVLETNHDRGLLMGGPYSYELKQRIASDVGHLSNAQSAALLAEILRLGPPPRLVICAHLSKTNNRPELARAALLQVLGRRPVTLLVAEQDRCMDPVEVTRAEVHRGPRRQLELWGQAGEF